MGLIEVGLLERVKGWFFPESQNPNNAGLFDHLEGWWGRFTVWAKLCLFIGIFVVLIAIWVCIKPELAQFIGYLLGGLLLFRQIAISGRRAAAAEETARAMQKTAQLTEKGNTEDRFEKAIEHLGHKSASTRLGGIYGLHYIAQEVAMDELSEEGRKADLGGIGESHDIYKEVKKYRERSLEVLCAHIRETTTQGAYKSKFLKSDWEVPTIEIQSVLDLLFISSRRHKIYKEFKANLEKANLKGAQLADTHLTEVNFSHATLDNANLARADMQKANLYMASFLEAELNSANLEGASLRWSKLRNVNLKAANLKAANLEKADLYQAKLSNAKLPSAELKGANLQRAELQATDLNKSDLRGTNLRGTNLRGADLRGADLLGADLRGADFKKTNLQGANLQGANLQDADLMGAKNLVVEQLLKAKTLYKAKLPDRIEEAIKQQKPELLKKPSSKKEA